MSEQSKRGLTLEELQPDYDDVSACPKTLTKSRHIDDIMYVAGRAPVADKTQYDLMFVTVAVEEEEAATQAKSTFGFRVTQPAEYLKGANGIIKDVALRAGIDLDRSYYTSCCKWLLPRTQRARPSKKIMKWGLPVLEDEIKRVEPKIIVCLGKHVFDLIGPEKINFKDAHGCWFWSEEFQAHMYVMHTPYTLVGKPELYETFRIDFKEITRRKALIDSGAEFASKDFNFHVIRNQEDLLDWVDRIEELAAGDEWPGLRTDEGKPLLAVDGEWHGNTHIDGEFRTIQFAWSETDAVVIEFLDEQKQWSFEIEDTAGRGKSTGAIRRAEGDTELTRATLYAAIGSHLRGMVDGIDARYIGHHFSADAVWMEHWLGIDTYEKCELDTEFAQQTVDESSELGLERGISMKYTNMGRYDQELVMWKRANKELCQGGYGYIPSAILHPYGAADVITPYRAYPMIRRQLEAQQLWYYYKTVFNPFVTDVFTEFTLVGLPMDIGTMDDLRHLFTFTKGKLEQKFRRRMTLEAQAKVRSMLVKEFSMKALMDPEIREGIEKCDSEILLKKIKDLLFECDKASEVPAWNSRILHMCDAPSFNLRSSSQMARWLFDFEGLTPIKTTNQKAKGLPSMSWDKVLDLPADRQALYKPAVDKQTLAILSEQLDTIDELLDLNAVGNLSKAFFKEPDIFIDPETGEEVCEENGLHAWLATDGRVHGMMSTTETGRPRSWRPNVLNWPSYVNKRISKSVARCIHEAHEEGDLPEELLKWVGKDADDLPSIRSCVKAPEGYILVESDYATAEMVALGKISGCKDLCRILEDPDPEWAKIKPDADYPAKVVRVSFADVSVTGVPGTAQDPKFIMNIWAGGECLGPVKDEDLLRDKDGKVVNAKYDIHWSLIERTYGKYREMMKAKVDRNAAKVLNFSSAYGASATSLERKIESDTGVKPEEGTGERGLEAIQERQPRATEFLEEMARVPVEKGFARAASGRIRHCLLHGAGSGVGWRTRNSIESALGRELRNFPMQESVGATAARACKWLQHAYRKLGLQARIMTCLYDSVVSMCPLEERHLVAKLHDLFMAKFNTWDYKDDLGERTLEYSIDNEFNWCWSTGPGKDDQDLLDSREWMPASERIAKLEKHPMLKQLTGVDVSFKKVG